MSFSRRTRLLALTAVGALLVSACGTRLTKEELLVTALEGQVTDSSRAGVDAVQGTSQASTSNGPDSTRSVPTGPATSAAARTGVADGSSTAVDDGSQSRGLAPGEIGSAPGDDPTSPPRGDVEAAKSPIIIGHIGTYSGLVGAISGGKWLAPFGSEFVCP